MANPKATMAERIRALKKQRKHDGENHLVQSRIPEEFWQKVNEQRLKDKLTWNELLTVCFDEYLGHSVAPREKKGGVP